MMSGPTRLAGHRVLRSKFTEQMLVCLDKYLGLSFIQCVQVLT